jgi:putative CocE/NonD family hydrolase
MRRLGWILSGLSLVAQAPPAAAPVEKVSWESRTAWMKANYLKTEHMVPMRDGKALYIAVFSPRDTSRTYPILFTRTPYGAVGRNYGPEGYPPALISEPAMHDGFILVVQDVRGRYRSGDAGAFEEVRAISNAGGVDESTDSNDTVAWMLKHLPGHNGKVGLIGLSYGGFYAACGLVKAHPAVQAAVVEAPVLDIARGDDFRRNGALHLVHSFTWLNEAVRKHDGATDKSVPPFDPKTQDAYRWFLAQGNAARAGEVGQMMGTTSWSDLMAHPDYDAFWQAKDLSPHLPGSTVPTLVVGGWFDGEDFVGTIRAFRALDSRPGNQAHLILGPWAHGSWRSMETFPGRSYGSSLGKFTWGENLALNFQQDVVLKFFKEQLKGEKAAPLAKVSVFDTGQNQWRDYPQWPPQAVSSKPLFIKEKGRAEWEAPRAAKGEDAFVSDPQRPVPHMADPIFAYGTDYPVADQRFASTRPDVMVYQTEVLSEDLTVAGPPTVDFLVSTTGTDSDWVVKVVDVWPDSEPMTAAGKRDPALAGFQELVRGDILRGRYRESLSHPRPMQPGVPTHIAFPLPDVFHTFRKGHRLMIQVQCSWFPLFDRNPQAFVDIAHATPEQFKKATQTLFRDASHPSKLVLPLLPHP